MRDVVPAGSTTTKLIVIRGNSGSGKTSIAQQLQRRHGRGCALVEQDYLRRIMLRERDKPGGLAPELIEHTVRFALDHDYHVILEGILYTDRYAGMLDSLRRAHRGSTYFFYLDVTLDETLRRHRMRPQASQFTAADMRGWYNPGDVLGCDHEYVLPETTAMEEAIAFIACTAALPVTGGDDDFLPGARHHGRNCHGGGHDVVRAPVDQPDPKVSSGTS